TLFFAGFPALETAEQVREIVIVTHKDQGEASGPHIALQEALVLVTLETAYPQPAITGNGILHRHVATKAAHIALLLPLSFQSDISTYAYGQPVIEELL